MGFIDTSEEFLLHTSVFLRRNLVFYGELKNIVRKRSLWKKVHLTKTQSEKIRSFLKQHYGYSYPTCWHRLYQSYTGQYCVDYFPEILLSSRLEPLLNPYRDAIFLRDKNLLHTFWDGIEHLYIPKTYVSCTRGILRNGEGHLISREEAAHIVNALEVPFVVKQANNTSSGKDVMICKPGKQDADEILSKYGKEFVVQEWIQQSEDLARLHPYSLNTFRVMTYICDGQIHVCPVALRMGRSGADRDNIHYGGIGIGVNTDGTLKTHAFAEYGERFAAHPDSGVVFEGYRIDGADSLLRNVAAACHERMPYLGLISWDFSINQAREVVLIEINVRGQAAWFSQMVNGESLFGKNTDKMLQMIRH